MSELRSYIFWYPAVVKKKKRAYVYDDKREDNPRFDTCSTWQLIRSAMTSIVVKLSPYHVKIFQK